ncbi:BPSS1780 family membrane protein [Dechloromonas hortensis]|uniref:BPSS1780 family membrane protein n=1 Tax=Dechloromonas hortensis TaxID=337779 RepID=UPI00129112C8|nr:BPSS1780 family membrane protein [Dechloromonas hortensis]
MNETPVFPLAPTPFKGESREVDAGACFDWLRQGWAMFLANPGVWIGCSVLLLIILMAISIVPFFGQVAAHLLVPLFGAGMVQVCRHLSEDDKTAEISDLFAGFRHNAGQLIMVGVFFAAGVFGLAFIAFLLISGGVLGGVVTGRVGGVGIAFGGIMLAGLLVMVLSVPVIMATWFAPALVFFHDMQPAAAMRASFDAGAKNWLAMVIFGVFLVVALFFAMLPLGLGLLLLLPVFSGAVYASYRDIFVGV